MAFDACCMTDFRSALKDQWPPAKRLHPVIKANDPVGNSSALRRIFVSFDRCWKQVSGCREGNAAFSEQRPLSPFDTVRFCVDNMYCAGVQDASAILNSQRRRAMSRLSSTDHCQS